MAAASNVFSVEQLFAGRLFHVPDYQRGYAWESQQRSEFLEDLEQLGPGQEHYTGTVVLHEVAPGARMPDAEGKSYGSVDVVDGQQRLATIVLLLDAIRRQLMVLESDVALTLADGIKRSYISATERSGQPLFKLTLNSDCDHYFKTVAIADQPGPEGPQITSEKRLAEAKQEFAAYIDKARLEAGGPAAFLDWLTDLHWKVTNQLRISLYEVESASEVGVIFEVMNNRGKPLSELEKVKNYLLYSGSRLTVSHNLDTAVNSAWAEIFRQLMAAGLTTSTDEDQLLRAHWLTAYDPQSRNWTGSKAIKSHFDLRKFRNSHEVLLDQLLRYTEGLRASCVAYCDARAPERPDSFASFGAATTRDDVKRWSAKLIRTNVVAPFLPLLIATRRRFAEQADKYLELVQLCESFAFRVYRLLERRADAGQGELFRIGFQLNRGDLSLAQAFLDMRLTLLRFSPNIGFEQALRKDHYDWYEWAGLKYFLYEYEEHLARKKGALPKVPWDQVRRRERGDTIEHIYPQTPTDGYWLERFDPGLGPVILHDLGNLSLTKDNASYGNRPFPEKRGTAGSENPCYATSPFFMERELSAMGDWTPDFVRARHERLAVWAEERWKVRAPLGEAPIAAPIGGEDEIPLA